MLELLAAALRRDLEERKLWHSLPHGSRSRACDLRKRRARGDECGRGGVSRAPRALPVLREHSWSSAGAFQRDASHPRISTTQWRWVGKGEADFCLRTERRPVCATARLGDFQGPCCGASSHPRRPRTRPFPVSSGPASASLSPCSPVTVTVALGRALKCRD